jgi:processive 1,2-diacylglycerol beta-glucosyltransferase
MLNVHILYEYGNDLRPHGSAYIRLLRPLTHPICQTEVSLSYGLKYQAADVVIVDRFWRPDISLPLVEHLVDRARADGLRLIYSIDDNLPALDVDGPIRVSTESLMAVRYLAREADGIIVSTEFLRARLSRLNSRIVVVPNALDERLIARQSSNGNKRSARPGPRVIGYMGTHTHDADIMMVLAALRGVLRRHRTDVEMQFVGGLSDSAVIGAFAGLPATILASHNHEEYPDFVHWMGEHLRWDVAIASLEDTDFTRCKSDIKFLDYSALGVAGIYSDVPAYRQSIRHLETGYLAENTSDAWQEGLELLLSDDPLRQGIAERAREHVLSSRTLEHCARNWVDAIQMLAGSTSQPL